MTAKILLVEDEIEIARTLEMPLAEAGFTLLHCLNLDSARKTLAVESLAAILLDLNLPDGNGIELCREIRRESTIPLLIITARRDEIDRIVGLEMGADDYIVKPFSPREVVARVTAVLRRQGWGSGDGSNPDDGENVITYGGIEVDEDRHQVMVDGRSISLTKTEYRLLLTLLRRPGQVYTREQIIEMVWDGAYIVDRVVDSVVSRLRRKLGTLPDGRARIRTVHSVGYSLTEPESP
ncbi:MAG: response regulator transcription factor [Deltaproteobacteria bacterium]|nr:response regulator transcription factor [Deltaproteobacteria bacterium]